MEQCTLCDVGVREVKNLCRKCYIKCRATTREVLQWDYITDLNATEMVPMKEIIYTAEDGLGWQITYHNKTRACSAEDWDPDTSTDPADESRIWVCDLNDPDCASWPID